MGLVMEANGGWSKCAQFYLNKIMLRKTIFAILDEEGRDGHGGRTLLARRFSMLRWRMAAIPNQKRMDNPGFRTAGQLGN